MTVFPFVTPVAFAVVILLAALVVLGKASIKQGFVLLGLLFISLAGATVLSTLMAMSPEPSGSISPMSWVIYALLIFLAVLPMVALFIKLKNLSVENSAAGG